MIKKGQDVVTHTHKCTQRCEEVVSVVQVERTICLSAGSEPVSLTLCEEGRETCWFWKWPLYLFHYWITEIKVELGWGVGAVSWTVGEEMSKKRKKSPKKVGKWSMNPALLSITTASTESNIIITGDNKA